MEAMTENNFVSLCGCAADWPSYSHSSRGQDFFLLPLAVRRLSGTEDLLNLTLRRELMESASLSPGDRLRVAGELRSFNRRQGEGARLVLTVFVRSISPGEGDEENLVRLRGTLCRRPTLRRTPLGREIADLMLAVNRRYARSDYLPCICWGEAARTAGSWDRGQRIWLEGRLQSREYVKLTEEGPIRRTAYEISAARLGEDREDPEKGIFFGSPD